MQSSHGSPRLSAPSLSSSLAAMLAGRAGPDETRVVVQVCHRLAKAYLQHRYVANRSRAGLTLDDQAMDAIADLFEMSGQTFPILDAYVEHEAGAIRSFTQAEVIVLLRPLVHGAVNDRVFESNSEVDGSLSRLIRSVKRAVKNASLGTLRRFDGVLYVIQSGSSVDGDTVASVAGRERPTIPIERLAARLAPSVRMGAQVPDFVAASMRLIRDHPLYDSSVPVTRLALAIRSAAVEVEFSAPAARAIPLQGGAKMQQGDAHLSSLTVERLLDDTVTDLRKAKRSYYVCEKKVSPERYEEYFAAIRSYLAARYLPPTDATLTQHEAFRLHCPGVEREAYRKHHRSTFEYLVRAVRGAFVEALQHHHRELIDS